LPIGVAPSPSRFEAETPPRPKAQRNSFPAMNADPVRLT
jgi:hypothetical protein